MTRVLFVDDERQVLDGMRRMLHSLRSEWDMHFIDDPLTVRAHLERYPADVIVTDMRMPGINGLKLLEQVKADHPETVRIVLSGQYEQGDNLRLIGVAHQYLAKPCHPEELKDAVARAVHRRARLGDESLVRLVSGLTSVPSMPVLFSKLMSLVESNESSIAEVAAVIAQDSGMTAKVLQLVNSSFFGLRRKVTDPRQAAMLLGLDNIVALALGTHVFTQMDRATAAGINLDAEHDRSMAVAIGARTIGKLSGVPENELSGYYLAGMLYDVGKLVLASNYAKRYLRMLGTVPSPAALPAAEVAEFGASHADVGSYLLSLWGLPDEAIEAVAHHHHPSEAAVRRFGPLTAVHIASAIAEADGDPPRFDTEYLLESGARSELESWVIELQAQMRTPDGSQEAAV